MSEFRIITDQKERRQTTHASMKASKLALGLYHVECSILVSNKGP